MRRNFVAGNWKMHGSKQAVKDLLTGIEAELDSVNESTEIVVCPSNLHIGLVESLRQSSRVLLGAQDCHAKELGAYTGDTSAVMLAEHGVDYVIVGHSERRQYYAESDSDVAEKFMAVQAAGLSPILCVGESLQQYQAGLSQQTVLAQLDAVIDLASIEAFANAVVAYEPVWAIGTGHTATPEQAQAVHGVIRQRIAESAANFSNNIAAGLRIIYGGSVNSGNAVELFAQQDIDGGLVGGASLKPTEFISICKSVD
ncbi:MAG: triose-phosphate isomerase [SAR86 cluster bacterium]|uniref:Triosephosphate isomerase n=1 Tax=SAR86 cluster bacterium TaxID=2030880 RepID=A0A2A4MEX9_9GAMM|nr:MAG: triose-phosphate isomerase [SAR86 cluster bacterium]